MVGHFGNGECREELDARSHYCEASRGLITESDSTSLLFNGTILLMRHCDTVPRTYMSLNPTCHFLVTAIQDV